MRPLWKAQFHPVDDHEFAAMLSLSGSSTAVRMYKRVIEMSPAADFPNSIHWRPGVWVVRALEAGFLGDNVPLYFFSRTVLLALLGWLGALFCRGIIDDLAGHPRVTLGTTTAIVIFGWTVISTPYLFDVFGRLLPGEMYSLLGLTAWLYAWGHLQRSKAAGLFPTRGHRLTGFVGLVLLAVGKEDALFLWPLAVIFSYPELRYLRKRGCKLTSGAYAASGLLWVAAFIQIVNTLFLRQVRLPYQSESTSTLNQVVALFKRLHAPSVILAFGSLILIILIQRRFFNGHVRVAWFLGLSMWFELLYVASVPVTAPRYRAVFTVLSLLFFALIFFTLCRLRPPPGRLTVRSATSVAILLLFLVQLGVRHQEARNLGYYKITTEWNAMIDVVVELTEATQTRQIVLVVDPPREADIGKWEKSNSFAKFIRFASKGERKIFMTIMSPRAVGVSSQALRSLSVSSRDGTSDAAGVIFQPLDTLTDGRILCVLYTSSGRTFDFEERCDSRIRLTL